MNRDDLLNLLASLKKGRGALVSDYCTEDPRLFSPMFLHKPYSNDMNIALDKYMFSWLAQHPAYYQGIIDSKKSEDSKSLNTQTRDFVNTYRKLCEKFIIGNNTHSSDKSHVLEKVIKESIDYLDTLLAVSEKADDRLERLRYQGEKSKYLFDRALKELKEEKNGIH